MNDTNNPAHDAHHGAYSLLVAQDGMNFIKIEIDDPVPLGRQVLTAAGMHGDDNYSLFNILESGDFEDVRLDEQIDLRRPGAERFIAFKSDRNFKLTVNGSQVVWGRPTISGADLYALSKPADGEAVFMVGDLAQRDLVAKMPASNDAQYGHVDHSELPLVPKRASVLYVGQHSMQIPAVGGSGFSANQQACSSLSSHSRTTRTIQPNSISSDI